MGPDGKYVEVDENGNPVIKKTSKTLKAERDSSDCDSSQKKGSGKRVKKYDADGNVYYDYPSPIRHHHGDDDSR